MKKELLKAWSKMTEKKQNEISRYINVSVNNINGYLAGRNEVRTDKLVMLTDLLGFELTVKSKL